MSEENKTPEVNEPPTVPPVDAPVSADELPTVPEIVPEAPVPVEPATKIPPMGVGPIEARDTCIKFIRDLVNDPFALTPMAKVRAQEFLARI